MELGLAALVRYGGIAVVAFFMVSGYASFPDARFLNVVASWPLWVAGVFLADCRAGRVRLPNRLWLAGGVMGLLTSGLLSAWCIIARQHPEGAVELVWKVAVFGVLGALTVGQFSAPVKAQLLWLSRPFRFLAPMSYSLYVVHYPVLAIMSALWLSQHEQLPLTPWLAIAGTGVSLAVALGAYCIAERPYLPEARRMRIHLSGDLVVGLGVRIGLRVPNAAWRMRAMTSG